MEWLSLPIALTAIGLLIRLLMLVAGIVKSNGQAQDKLGQDIMTEINLALDRYDERQRKRAERGRENNPVIPSPDDDIMKDWISWRTENEPDR